ncbi:unnamed protein product [Chrysoparadoxa australica]
MSGFISRIIHYVAGEVVTKGLAENRTFQRFAVKTQGHLQKARTVAASANKQAMNNSGPSAPKSTFTKFQEAFAKEVSKDFKN